MKNSEPFCIECEKLKMQIFKLENKNRENEQYINRLCEQIAESGRTVANLGMQIHEMRNYGAAVNSKFDYTLKLTEKSRQALHIAK